MLHLDQRPLAGLVSAVERLGDHAVEPGALEPAEPLVGDGPRSVLAGVRWTVVVDRRPASRAGRAEPTSARSSNDGRRRRARRTRRTRRVSPRPAGRSVDLAGWMRCSSASKSSPLPPVSATTISPSIMHRSGRAGEERFDQFGEVARQRAQLAAEEFDPVTVAEHDAAEAVPFRFVQPAVAVGDRSRQLGEHRFDRWLQREIERRVGLFVAGSSEPSASILVDGPGCVDGPHARSRRSTAIAEHQLAFGS